MNRLVVSLTKYLSISLAGPIVLFTLETQNWLSLLIFTFYRQKYR